MIRVFYMCLVDWLEKRQLPCFYKSILGIECPGCGMQRAFIALLRGDLIGSIQIYPALIPTIAMLILLVVHVFLHLKNGAKMLIWFFIINSGLIVISYIYKLIV